MKIIDTHAHLCDNSFDGDLDDVLSRAAGAGVCMVLAVSEDLSGVRGGFNPNVVDLSPDPSDLSSRLKSETTKDTNRQKR